MLQFPVWLSVADSSINLLLLLLYINRIVSNSFFFLLQQSPERPKKVVVVGKLEHEERAFSRAENSSLSKLFSFYLFNVLVLLFFCHLIILKFYVFFVSVCVGVCLCVCVYVVGKIDYDIKKQQFLGEENIFFSSLQHWYSM